MGIVDHLLSDFFGEQGSDDGLCFECCVDGFVLSLRNGPVVDEEEGNNDKEGQSNECREDSGLGGIVGITEL